MGRGRKRNRYLARNVYDWAKGGTCATRKEQQHVNKRGDCRRSGIETRDVQSLARRRRNPENQSFINSHRKETITCLSWDRGFCGGEKKTLNTIEEKSAKRSTGKKILYLQRWRKRVVK